MTKTKRQNEMSSTKFRTELMKIMPGYKWTVHRRPNPKLSISATGIMSSGFNRMSTLHVIKRGGGWVDGKDGITYEASSSGFGLNAPWLAEYTDGTLARALRGLQDHYSNMADNYFGHKSALQAGRKPYQ